MIDLVARLLIPQQTPILNRASYLGIIRVQLSRGSDNSGWLVWSTLVLPVLTDVRAVTWSQEKKFQKIRSMVGERWHGGLLARLPSDPDLRPIPIPTPFDPIYILRRAVV